MPTASVSTPIFQELLKQSYGPLFIYGHFGIAKTTSLMLYAHFSYLINSYLYLAGSERRESFRKSLEKDEKYIPKKMFYWSMGPILDFDEQIK